MDAVGLRRLGSGPMKVMGLMSGTSLDGVDAAVLEIDGSTTSDFGWRLLAFHSERYGDDERGRIRRAIEGGSASELTRLHARLGERFASVALACLTEAGLERSEVAAIGSHGQTVWHHPPANGVRGATLQLGDPATIADRTGIAVVADFRARDVAAGGHGAPLVPWPDRLLFSSSSGARAVQNIGGMANVTWLPRSGDATPTFAFDTGPGMVLIDTAAELASRGASTFDVDGALAGAGTVDEDLLDELMAHPFIGEDPPKSTGRETFGSSFVHELVARRTPSDTEDWSHLVATLTAFTARSISDAYRRWLLPRGVDEVYLAGGGTRHPVLRAMIARDLDPLPVADLSALGLEADAREAACFAVLAWAHLHGIPGNAPGATGAEGARVLGSLTPGGP